MKKEIVYTQHLKLRLKIREINENIPQQIYKSSKEKYFDSFTGYYVAIGKTYYKDKVREMAVIYEETTDKIKIVTIYPLKFYEKISKIESRRWQKI